MNSPIIIGHRGARGLALENTVASLQKAINYSVQLVEFDVRVTADGQCILHHDPIVRDAGGGQLQISNHTFKELAAHKPDLATLAAAAAAVNHRAGLLIEIKPGVPLPPIIAELRRLLRAGWEPDELAITSRSYPILKGLHAALPELSLVIIDRWSGMRASWRGHRLHTKRLSMNQRWLWSGFIAGMSRRGWQLYTYTLNDPAKAERWAEHGLAGVITDYPDRFRTK